MMISASSIASITPPDFSLTINYDSGDVMVPLGLIHALTIAFLALVSADEEDWLHLEISSSQGQVSVQSDPSLDRYLSEDPIDQLIICQLNGISIK